MRDSYIRFDNMPNFRWALTAKATKFFGLGRFFILAFHKPNNKPSRCEKQD